MQITEHNLPTQANISHSTTEYTNDVTWESVGEYVRLFHKCWKIIPDNVGNLWFCGYPNDKNVYDHQGIGYPCTTLQDEFRVNIEKVKLLIKDLCPKTYAAEDFDKKVSTYNQYDHDDYIGNLLLAGTAFSACAAGGFLVSAVYHAFKTESDTKMHQGFMTQYALPISKVHAMIVSLVSMGISAATLGSTKGLDQPKECYEYEILQDMGYLAQNLTGIDYFQHI